MRSETRRPRAVVMTCVLLKHRIEDARRAGRARGGGVYGIDALEPDRGGSALRPEVVAAAARRGRQQEAERRGRRGGDRRAVMVGRRG